MRYGQIFRSPILNHQEVIQVRIKKQNMNKMKLSQRKFLRSVEGNVFSDLKGLRIAKRIIKKYLRLGKILINLKHQG